MKISLIDKTIYEKLYSPTFEPLNHLNRSTPLLRVAVELIQTFGVTTKIFELLFSLAGGV